MGDVVVTEFVSLDGVIEAPGGGEEYELNRAQATALYEKYGRLQQARVAKG